MPHHNDESRVSQAIAAIRHDILVGIWKPGERLPLVPLAKKYDTSTTVVRESLMQMSSKYLVANEANHGFSVPYLSIGNLADLNRVRCHCEDLALRMSFERGDLMWESDVVAAHHRLQQTPRWGAGDHRGISDAWLEGAKDFHRTLISACGVTILTDLADALEDATSLYRLWSRESADTVTRNLADEHDGIVQAVVAKDADRAVGLLRRHYEASVKLILDAGLLPEAERPEPRRAAAGRTVRGAY
ncbi:GntR family transcriptional regulator [Arthrobacter sp. I2-34]|uniref:GntR family transcriptional regulator n=1 Tax=Arthrobacter hankyongi TaxID=2904801 RepID=A0ABS9L8P8_9MICC|nr:GntR family transcriptional regulator [Arthrobacter hankyongi]MCG2623055.1 GntR family transcriptional regulator [Arthrobacter hankyongi]